MNTQNEQLATFVRSAFGPDGLFALAAGQVRILEMLRAGPSDASQLAPCLGAHERIVQRALVSLERKGLAIRGQTSERRYCPSFRLSRSGWLLIGETLPDVISYPAPALSAALVRWVRIASAQKRREARAGNFRSF